MATPAKTDRLLAGRRIVVTRAAADAADLLARLRELGAEPIECPAIAIIPPDTFAPLDAAVARLDQYDWLIFTSAHAVTAFAGRLPSDPAPMPAIAAIGPATARALALAGLTPRFVPATHTAAALLAGIGDVRGQRILLPNADIARDTLAVGLRAAGAEVDEIPAYRTVPGGDTAQLAAMLREGSIDAITFASSSAVRYLLQMLNPADWRGDPAVVCIGPQTAHTASELGLRHIVVAQEYTTSGLISSLIDLFAAPERKPTHA